MTSPSVVSTLIFFLHALRFAAGQFRTVPAPPPPSDPNYGGSVPRFTPIMGIVMVVLVVVFFLMGFCSVYIRRCAQRRFGSRFDFDPNLNFRLGRAAPEPTAGLDAAVIESFPTFVYSEVKRLKIGEASLECAVCLNEFQDNETLRLIPNCSHVFHPVCIDSWLSSHSTCPVCRSYLVPKPGDPSILSPRFRFPNLDVEPQTASDRMHTCTDEPVPVQQETERSNISESPDRSNRRPPHWTKSNRWRITDLFPRSHSTGHSLVQPGDDIERFTLRLPEEVRNELLNSTLNRTRSCVVFPREMSAKRSYRFDRYHRLDRPGCFPASPIFFGTGSVLSLKRESDNESASSNGPRKELFKSVRWPLDRLKQSGRGNESVSETSSDRLRPDSEV